MFHEALRPRPKGLFGYPTRRRKDDKLTYRVRKVYQPDFPPAAKVLSPIARELDLESLEALADPYMVKRSYANPEQFDAELEALSKQDPDASRDLDKTFGLI